MSLRDSAAARVFYDQAQRRLLPALAASGLTPNQITVAGAVIAVLVPIGFAVHPAYGLAAMLLSGLCDALDGLLARAMIQSSRFGAFLDSSLDRFSDACYLSGFFVLLAQEPAHGRALAVILLVAGLTGQNLISYVKARAQGLGIECRRGLLERGPRTIYLMVWALTLSLTWGDTARLILWIGWWLFAGLAWYTVAERMAEVRRALL